VAKLGRWMAKLGGCEAKLRKWVFKLGRWVAKLVARNCFVSLQPESETLNVPKYKYVHIPGADKERQFA